MGCSRWATIGNQMDVRFNDFVRYIEQDDHTKVMLLYMEGLRVENEGRMDTKFPKPPAVPR